MALGVVSFIVLANTTGRNDGTSAASLDSYKGLPVYWVGDEYEGVPLDRVILPADDDSVFEQVFVTYGACGNAFESGCDPPFLLKITRDCLTRIHATERVRGRTMFQDDHLAVQTGDAVVEIFADPGMQRRIANDMVVANVMQFPAVRTGEDLPGSLCEVIRFSPATPTRTPEPTSEVPTVESQQEREERELAERVFDSLGGSRDFDSFQEAEAYLGWKLVRTMDPRYTTTYICCEAGFTREHREQPLFEQRYAVIGRKSGIDLYQEPESNGGFDASPYGTEVTIGLWTGILWEYRAQRGFKFLSSKNATGERIRVSVVGDRDEITEEDIRNFAEELYYGDQPPPDPD